MKPGPGPIPVSQLWLLLILGVIAVALVVLVHEVRDLRRTASAPPPATNPPPSEVAPDSSDRFAVQPRIRPPALPNPPVPRGSPAAAPASPEATNAVGEVASPVPAPASRSARLAPVPPPPDAGFVGKRPKGLVFGSVFLRSNPPPETSISMDAVCAGLQITAPAMTESYRVGEDGALADVFVYLAKNVPTNRTPLRVLVNRLPKPVLRSIGCRLEPRVSAVLAGQLFRIETPDPCEHRLVFAPPTRSKFRVDITSEKPLTQVGLTDPAVLLPIQCTRHAWETGYVSVVEHPWFAVTDREGRFAFPEDHPLPPGRYVVAARHPNAGEIIREITVSAAPAEPLSFYFGPR